VHFILSQLSSQVQSVEFFLQAALHTMTPDVILNVAPVNLVKTSQIFWCITSCLAGG